MKYANSMLRFITSTSLQIIPRVLCEFFMLMSDVISVPLQTRWTLQAPRFCLSKKSPTSLAQPQCTCICFERQCPVNFSTKGSLRPISIHAV